MKRAAAVALGAVTCAAGAVAFVPDVRTAAIVAALPDGVDAGDASSTLSWPYLTVECRGARVLRRVLPTSGNRVTARAERVSVKVDLMKLLAGLREPGGGLVVDEVAVEQCRGAVELPDERPIPQRHVGPPARQVTISSLGIRESAFTVEKVVRRNHVVGAPIAVHSLTAKDIDVAAASVQLLVGGRTHAHGTIHGQSWALAPQFNVSARGDATDAVVLPECLAAIHRRRDLKFVAGVKDYVLVAEDAIISGELRRVLSSPALRGRARSAKVSAVLVGCAAQDRDEDVHMVLHLRVGETHIDTEIGRLSGARVRAAHDLHDLALQQSLTRAIGASVLRVAAHKGAAWLSSVSERRQRASADRDRAHLPP